MHKIFLLSIVFLLLISSVSAAPPFKSIELSGGLTVSPNIPIAIPQNQSRAWEIHLANISTIITSGATCEVHIYDEDNTGLHLYHNRSSSFSSDHIYDIEILTNGSENAEKGVYSYKVICNTTSQAGFYEGQYYVTKNGNIPADDIFQTIIYILFFISLAGLIVTLVLTIAKIATANETIYGLLLSWFFYVLMFFTQYLGANYLITTFIEDFGQLLLTITMWSNVVLPVIGLIITIIYKSTRKKNPLTPQELTGGNLLRYG